MHFIIMNNLTYSFSNLSNIMVLYVKIYLIQHAEAKNKMKDPNRPLTEKGIFNLQKISKYAFESLSIKIDKIYHSEKRRSIETAQILSEFLNPLGGITYMEGLNPNDSIDIILNKLEILKENVMIVGHLPHIEKLSSFLLCGDKNRKIINFKNSCIACFDINKDRSSTIDYIIFPDLI